MLEFIISNQELKRADDTKPATDSVEYLQARFTVITDDWARYTDRYAVFTAGDITKRADIINDVCTVPWEVLEKSNDIKALVSGNKISVTVIGISGSSRVTTNELVCSLNASGYLEGEHSDEPTPDLYAQYVAEVNAAADRADAAAADAEGTLAEVGQLHADIRNNYANAVKGNVSGEVIRVDDVSSIEHTAKAKVNSKNLFNHAQLAVTDTYQKFTVAVEAGKTYTASSNIPYGGAAEVYFNGDYTTENGVWDGQPRTFTATTNEMYIAFQNRGNAQAVVDGTYYIQLEKGAVATPYTPYIDPATVTLTRRGKAVFAAKEYELKSQTAYAWSSILMAKIKVPLGIYTASCKYTQVGEKSKTALSMRDYDDHAKTLKHVDAQDTTGTLKATFEVKDGNQGFQMFLYSNYSENKLTTDCIFYDIQVECGSTATEYEPYSAESYTPNADGTVDVISINPTMTLTTDTEGVNIDCEYNRDTTKMFESYVLTDDAKAEIVAHVEDDLAEVLTALNEYTAALIGGVS